MKYSKVLVLISLLVMAIGSVVSAQTLTTTDSTTDSTTERATANPEEFTAYVHVTGSLGLGLVTSDDVTDLFEDATDIDFGIGIGVPFTYGLCGGYRNIVQAQFRKGSCSHNLNHNDIIGTGPDITIEMDYDFDEKLLKFNPLFMSMSPNKAFFFVVGTGTVEFLDENGDGYTGKSTILGVEYSTIKKNVTYGMSLLHSNVDLDEFILGENLFTSNAQAGDWVVQFNVSVGLGM